MNHDTAIQLMKANTEFILLLAAAFAVGAWMIFRVSEYFATDDLGAVDVAPRLKDWLDEDARRGR